MKRAFEAHAHVATRHAGSKWLVVLTALVLGLSAVALQPPVAPAQQSVGDHSDISGDPTPITEPAPSAESVPGTDSVPSAESAPGTDPTSNSAIPTPSESEPTDTSTTSTQIGSPQLRAAGGPRAIGAQAAQSAVLLGTTESFAVLGGTTVTNNGLSVISGDVGVSPGLAVTGFPPGTVDNGTIHRGDEVAAQAQADLTTAYNDAAGRIPTEQVATELGGQTLTTGVYDSASGTFGITGALTLDGQGDPDAVFIFQTESTLITASASRVVFINGAQACNVFWQIGSSATLGTNSSFAGNILALTSITANTGATVDGRLLARNGAVTLDTNTITTSECAVAVAVPDPDEGGPTDDTTGGGDDTTGGGDTGGDSDDTTGGGGDTTGGGDTGGDSDDTTGGGGDTTDGGDTTGDDGDTTGGGTGDTTTTTIATGRGTDDTGGGDGGGTGRDEGGPTTQDDQSGTSTGSLPFTGLDIGIPALVGTVLLLLGAGLRTKVSASKA